MRVLVFDTETTGLPKERNASITSPELWPHILQLSYILYDTDTKKIMTCKDHLIKIGPKIEITPGSFAIHGITPSACKRKGILIESALNEFNVYLNQADIVIGHNISFDKRMIMVECIRNKIRQQFTINGIRKFECCTMKCFTELCAIEVENPATGEKYFKFPKLSELHMKLFNVMPKSLHDALADVLICLRCYVYEKHQHDITKEGCALTKELYKLYCV
jgi:DNA polymerase-3 subunit epsilon